MTDSDSPTPSWESDPERLLAQVRFDVLERHRRGLPWSVEHYLSTLPVEAAAPGSPVMVLLIGLELGLKGTTPEALKARLDPADHEVIDRLAARREELEAETAASVDAHERSTASDLPPTEVGAGVGDSQREHVGQSSEPHGVWSKGDRIGPFTLRKRLGAGAFGEVWLASRKSPDLEVAIKVLKPGETTPDNVRRFEIEAQALAFLEHRYIAKIHDAGTARGLPYIAMEYIEGKPLTRYCDERRLSLAQRLELMVRICEGVQHAHQRGLIHRDLKPDNILVTEIVRHPKEIDEHERRLVVDRTDGRATIAVPKIVDFGLAKAAEKTVRLADGTLTVDLGKIMGTPEYMAPEQAGHQPQEVTQKADIFSLGVVLYELISGTLPLTKEELRRRAIEELVAFLRGTPRPEPSTRFSKLDEETVSRVSYQRGEMDARELGRRLRGRVRHLCGTALRLEPEKRFTSVAAMALDIRNYLEEKDYLEAAAEPRRDKVLRHLRRHKLPYAAAAALFIALVAGAVGTSVGFINASRERDRAIRQEQIASALNQFLLSAIESPRVDDLGPGVSLREVLKAGEDGFADADKQDPIVGIALRLSYGRSYRALGLQDDAHRILRDALDRVRRLQPTDAGIEQEIRGALGLLLLEMGRHSEMFEIVGRDAWSYIGGALHDLGDYPLAEFAYSRNLDALEASDPVDDVAVARAHDSLARLYVDAGLLPLARPLIERSLATKQRRGGRDSRTYQFGRLTEAYLLSQSGEWEAVKAIYAEVHEFYRRLNKNLDSPMVALTEMEVAGAEEDDPTSAGPPAPDARLVDRLGALRPVAAIQLRNRGRTLAGLDRLPDASDRFERSIAIARSLPEETAATSESHTRRIWARVLRERGDHIEALKQNDLAMDLVRSTYAGDRSEQLAPLLIQRGRILSALGRHEEALSTLERAVRLREGGIGADAWPEHAARLEFAAAFSAAGDRETAQTTLGQSITPLRRAWTEEDPRRERLDEILTDLNTALTDPLRRSGAKEPDGEK